MKEGIEMFTPNLPPAGPPAGEPQEPPEWVQDPLFDYPPPDGDPEHDRDDETPGEERD